MNVCLLVQTRPSCLPTGCFTVAIFTLVESHANLTTEPCGNAVDQSSSAAYVVIWFAKAAAYWGIIRVVVPNPVGVLYSIACRAPTDWAVHWVRCGPLTFATLTLTVAVALWAALASEECRRQIGTSLTVGTAVLLSGNLHTASVVLPVSASAASLQIGHVLVNCCTHSAAAQH